MKRSKEEFKIFIDKILKDFDPFLSSSTAIYLLMGTCAQESAFGKYTKQIGGGPARGIFQMERPTFDWLKSKYKKRYKRLESVKFEDLEFDDELAVIFARLRYLVVPKSLPENNPRALAEYWKKFYNTVAGKGTVEEFIRNYKKYVEGR